MCIQFGIRYEECNHVVFERRGYVKRCGIAREEEIRDCGRVRPAQIPYPRVCPDCLISSFHDELTRTEFISILGPLASLDIIEQGEAEAVMQLALCLCHQGRTPVRHAGPGSGHTHIYSRNARFEGPLKMRDILWLLELENMLHSAIWGRWQDPDRADPTRGQLALYLQIRDALLTNVVYIYHVSLDLLGPFWVDDTIRRNTGPAMDQSTTSRLQRIFTPVSLGELAPDQTDCIICAQELGKPRDDGTTEQAVKLPCGHVHGRDCLQRWVEDTMESDSFRVCTVCRATFGLESEEELPNEPVLVLQDMDEITFNGAPLKLPPLQFGPRASTGRWPSSGPVSDAEFVWIIHDEEEHKDYVRDIFPYMPVKTPWWLHMLKRRGVLMFPDGQTYGVFE